MEKILDDECLVIEKETQIEIETSVNNHENIIVDAGAGSGKTYSLIELLRNLIKENSKEFLYTNQNIMCITYTNAATNEIKERLGESKIVAVSTIHERIWDIIKIYKKQLREIHIDKIKSICESFEEELEANEIYQEYKSNVKLEKYFEFIYSNFSTHYWNVQNAKAASIHNEVGGNFTKGELKGKLSKLKEMTRAYYNFHQYHSFLRKDSNQMEVTYNFLSNRDNLLKFEISHDTLLEYGLELIKKDSIFKKIIIDRFPLVVVDEYQDTASDVLEMLMHLDEFAKDKKLSFTIALFGDKIQSIYDNKYSTKVENYFLKSDNFKKISKKFNYRSSKTIIEIGNKIRMDGMEQRSPYQNIEFGFANYKKTSHENLDAELSEIKEKWEINNNNKLNCLVLKNEDIAHFLGMKNIYKAIKKMKFYTVGMNYKLLSDHILSRDRIKLGQAQVAILNILELYMKVNQQNIYLSDILPKNLLNKLTIQEANNYLFNIRSNYSSDLITFDEYLDVFFGNYRNASDDVLKVIYEQFNPEKFNDVDSFKCFIKEIFREEKNDNINTLFNINLKEYIDWYNYLYKAETLGEIEYQTYHNTKGLEFENVVIVMSNQMGRAKDYFEFYLSNRENWKSLTDSDFNNKFVPARNLLYVATTRAIKNLQILYLDDIEPVETEFNVIFSNID